MRNANSFVVALLVILSPFALGAGRSNSVFQTKHNLSASGPGEIRAYAESRVCIFCHSSHNASPEGPLWNHETTSPAQFKVYDRPSMKGQPEQPTGATKLCLSCHDGTIAVGALHGRGRPVPMEGVSSEGTIPAGRTAHIGTDLSGSHPVSLKYEHNLTVGNDHLRWPPFDPEREVGLDANGYVQCTACHDPHSSRSERYPLWRKATFDEVCLVCHEF